MIGNSSPWIAMATFTISDTNGWWDVDYVQFILVILMTKGFDLRSHIKTEDGEPQIFLESGAQG